MDHRWGRNVSELGLGDTGCTICSRFIDGTGPTDVVITNTPGDRFTFWDIALDPRHPLPWHRNLGIKMTPHFPYGFRVIPDEPV